MSFVKKKKKENELNDEISTLREEIGQLQKDKEILIIKTMKRDKNRTSLVCFTWFIFYVFKWGTATNKTLSVFWLIISCIVDGGFNLRDI